MRSDDDVDYMPLEAVDSSSALSSLQPARSFAASGGESNGSRSSRQTITSVNHFSNTSQQLSERARAYGATSGLSDAGADGGSSNGGGGYQLKQQQQRQKNYNNCSAPVNGSSYSSQSGGTMRGGAEEAGANMKWGNRSTTSIPSFNSSTSGGASRASPGSTTLRLGAIHPQPVLRPGGKVVVLAPLSKDVAQPAAYGSRSAPGNHSSNYGGCLTGKSNSVPSGAPSMKEGIHQTALDQYGLNRCNSSSAASAGGGGVTVSPRYIQNQFHLQQQQYQLSPHRPVRGPRKTISLFDGTGRGVSLSTPNPLPVRLQLQPLTPVIVDAANAVNMDTASSYNDSRSVESQGNYGYNASCNSNFHPPSHLSTASSGNMGQHAHSSSVRAVASSYESVPPHFPSSGSTGNFQGRHAFSEGSESTSTSVASFAAANGSVGASHAAVSQFCHAPLELRNFGATCYMNATLQCILHTPGLLAALSHDEKNLVAVLKNRRGDSIKQLTGSKQSSFLAVNLPATSSLVELGTASPRITPGQLLLSIKQAAAGYNSEFDTNGQNDAHEFLRTILYVVHDEINRGAGRSAPYEEVKDVEKESEREAMQRWVRRLRSVDDSTVYDYFGGVLRSRCECQVCGFASMTFDPFLDLSLPVSRSPNSTRKGEGDGSGGASTTQRKGRFPFSFKDSSSSLSVDDILRQSFADDTMEILTGGNQLLCTRCKKLRDGRRWSRVMSWPRMLVIHLNRFTHQGKKNCAKVVYPHTFSIGTQRYYLYGVCCHTGTESSGHYTSYVCVHTHAETDSPCNKSTSSHAQRFRSQMDKWYHCNDNNILEVDTKEVMSAVDRAYMLFYRQL